MRHDVSEVGNAVHVDARVVQHGAEVRVAHARLTKRVQCVHCNVLDEVELKGTDRRDRRAERVACDHDGRVRVHLELLPHGGQDLRRDGAVRPVEALVHLHVREILIRTFLGEREVVDPVGDVHAAAERHHDRIVQRAVADEALEVVSRVCHDQRAVDPRHESARPAAPVANVLLLAVRHGRHVRQVQRRGFVVRRPNWSHLCIMQRGL